MILHSLEMENFRQYYGNQSIQFADSNGGPIVTVVLGENGRGKTGIYRAIMFALFGDTKLEQDSHESDIILTNLKALEENPKGVHSAVTVMFSSQQHSFKLTRSYFALKCEDGSIKEQLFSILLENETTNESWTTEKSIHSEIQKMVDERVKHYFFFDGERIERLTRVALQQREEIAAGVKNLLKIDQVVKSREVLKEIFSKVKKELHHHSKGEYKRALFELSELEQKETKLTEQQNNLNQGRIASEIRLQELNDLLKNFESMKDLFLERERLEDKALQLRHALSAKMEQARTINKYLPLLLGKDVYHATLARLRGEIDYSSNIGIQSSFISQLLEDMRCICGSDLHQESHAQHQLLTLRESIRTYEKNKSFHDLYQAVEKLLSYLDGRNDACTVLLNEIRHLNVQQEEITSRLEQLNGRLRSVGEDEINSFNDERTHHAHLLVQYDFDSKKLEEEQAELKKEATRKEVEVQELKRKSGIREQLLHKHDTLKKSITSMTSLISAFEKEVIEELERATDQNLHYLLDDAGRAMIKKVKIQPGYSLEVLNSFNQPFLANISQGQRQVLSISFITALAQVAGGHSILEMPLLMDTPFGRLSSVHQQRLIEYLPQICSQWVLLVTDREFGPQEQAMFLETNSIGKFYKLTSVEPGVTIIEEADKLVLAKGVN